MRQKKQLGDRNPGRMFPRRSKIRKFSGTLLRKNKSVSVIIVYVALARKKKGL